MKTEQKSPQSASSASIAVARSAARKRKILLFAVATVIAAVGFGYWYFGGSNTREYENCVKQTPKNVVVQGNKLACVADGKTYTSSQTAAFEKLKTHQDETISFRYPGSWTVEKINNLNSPGGYLVTIESDLTDGHLTSGNRDTKFQITANIWIKKKAAPIAPCYKCTVQEAQNSREIVFSNPAAKFQPVFGKSSAIDGSPVIMSINSKKMAAGTKDYQAFATLPDGRRVVVRAQAEFQDTGKMFDVSSVADFLDSSVYRTLESIFYTINIK